MRFRLRYLHHDLELTEGTFAVGRNASCQLSLDDPLVSRRHALLTVTADKVTLEDLNSRNGVIVNGRRIEKSVVLQPGDRVLIGSQELTLLLARDERTMATPATGKRTLPKLPSLDELASRSDVTSRTVSTPSPSQPLLPETHHEGENEPSMVRRADAFNLLGSVAEKALAMGRADEAERLLMTPLADVMEACRGGKRLSAPLTEVAARFASKLASATGKGVWADYVIELYASQERMCPAPVIDELYNAFRKVNAIDLARVRGYVQALREKLPAYGPADRFLFQRIEGLERLAALR